MDIEASMLSLVAQIAVSWIFENVLDFFKRNQNVLSVIGNSQEIYDVIGEFPHANFLD